MASPPGSPTESQPFTVPPLPDARGQARTAPSRAFASGDSSLMFASSESSGGEKQFAGTATPSSAPPASTFAAPYSVNALRPLDPVQPNPLSAIGASNNGSPPMQQLSGPVTVASVSGLDQTKMKAAGDQVLNIRPYGKTFIVSGQTKEHRFELKKLGKASWTPRPTDGGEMGWRYFPGDFDKVLAYVTAVNQDQTPAPTGPPEQSIYYRTLLPQPGMEMLLKYKTSDGEEKQDVYVIMEVKERRPIDEARLLKRDNPQQAIKMQFHGPLGWQVPGWAANHSFEPIMPQAQ